MHIPSLPSYLNSQLVPDPYVNQQHLHQADETTPEALPTSGLPRLPCSAPLAARRPRNLPEPTNVPLNSTSALGQTQIQVATHPSSTSTTLYEFGGNATAPPAPPVPLATVNPATDHSNTIHTCQCVTGGSPCNAVMDGSVRFVRDHLNGVHGFRGTGKDLVECLWGGCEKKLQRESIPRHIVTCHLRVKVSCVECGLLLSRSDVQYSHAKTCRARRRNAYPRLSTPTSR